MWFRRADALARRSAMEKTIDRINADIASLRANAALYRNLAEQRRAVDQQRVAAKLMELVIELETKAKELAAHGGE